MIKKMLVLLIISSAAVFASDHGIYLLIVKNSKASVNETAVKISEQLKTEGFTIIASRDVATPDIVREKKEDFCGFKVKQIVFTSDEYKKFLSSYGDKYLTAALLKAAVYETPDGVQVNIADPETINRIVFNDIYDNGEEAKYLEAVKMTLPFKKKIVDAIHSLNLGESVDIPMEPIRDDEDLADASKDMFMMVGSMTLFADEDQFPIIYKIPSKDAKKDVRLLLGEIKTNLEKFKPSQDDIDYRLTKSPDVLKWQIIAEEYSPDSAAVTLGLTRARTEGLSFDIAGSSREDEVNKCPGIDHAAAYPIEVVIYKDEDNLVVRTAREMFRMDMYFWDAGMMAFMDHMSMPDILDTSLRKALLGDKYEE